MDSKMARKSEIGSNSIFKFRIGDALWGNIFKKDVSQKETTISILKRVPIFQGLNKSDLHEFEKIIHLRHFKADETIFWEGEPGVGMYIVQEGLVAICIFRVKFFS